MALDTNCWHEAGHAVAAEVLSPGSVVSVVSQHGAGQVESVGDLVSADRVVQKLAGLMAETIAGGLDFERVERVERTRRRYRRGTDLHCIDHDLGGLRPDSIDRCREILTAHWSAVEAIAGSLHDAGRLDSVDVFEIVHLGASEAQRGAQNPQKEVA